MNSTHRRVWALIVVLAGTSAAFAHHTYATFDGSGTRTVTPVRIRERFP